MTVNVINDRQRLEELTEWCRNKPEDAAIRIMVAEGLCEPLGGNAEDGPKDLAGIEVLETITDAKYHSSPRPSGTLSPPVRMRINPKTIEARNNIINAHKSRGIVIISGLTCVIEKIRTGMGEEFIAREVRKVDTTPTSR